MGSFSIFHWLILLILIGIPVWLVMRDRRRKRLEDESRRARGLDPNDRTRA